MEIRNQTIMKMVRCMLKEITLTKKFWEAAAKTIVYILNRAPIVGLEDITPYEFWIGTTRKKDFEMAVWESR